MKTLSKLNIYERVSKKNKVWLLQASKHPQEIVLESKSDTSKLVPIFL